MFRALIWYKWDRAKVSTYFTYLEGTLLYYQGLYLASMKISILKISILKYLHLTVFAKWFQVFYNCFKGSSTFQELFIAFNLFFAV